MRPMPATVVAPLTRGVRNWSVDMCPEEMKVACIDGDRHLARMRANLVLGGRLPRMGREGRDWGCWPGQSRWARFT